MPRAARPDALRGSVDLASLLKALSLGAPTAGASASSPGSGTSSGASDFVMILALLAMAVQAPPPPQRVLIQDVTVVSPERRAPLRHGYVVLEGERIARVGQGTPPAGQWDSVISGGGRVLIPGLIDGHTHLAMPAGLPVPLPATFRRSPAVTPSSCPGATSIRDSPRSSISPSSTGRSSIG